MKKPTYIPIPMIQHPQTTDLFDFDVFELSEYFMTEYYNKKFSLN